MAKAVDQSFRWNARCLPFFASTDTKSLAQIRCVSRDWSNKANPVFIQGLLEKWVQSEHVFRHYEILRTLCKSYGKDLALTAAALEHPDRDMRLHAVRLFDEPGLSALPHMSALASKLEDESAVVQEAALKVLAQLGPAAAAHAGALAAKLRDPRSEVRFQAGVVLGRLGPAAVDHALAYLHDPGEVVRLAVLETLEQLGPARVQNHHIEAVATRLADPNLHVRQRAAIALWRLGPASADHAGALAAALADEAWLVRCAAARALGGLGPAAADHAAALAIALADKELYVRRAAGDALEKLGTVRAEHAGFLATARLEPATTEHVLALAAKSSDLDI